MAVSRGRQFGVARHLENFGNYTSMPGIVQIVESRSTAKRVAWIIVLVIAWTFFAIELSFVLLRYLAYPKTLTTDIVATGVPFPDITFCNLGSFDYYTVYKMSKGLHQEDASEDAKSNSKADKQKGEPKEADLGENEDANSKSEADQQKGEKKKADKLQHLQDAFIRAISKYYFISQSIPHMEDQQLAALDMLYSRTTVASNVPQSLLSANGYQKNEFIVKCTFKSMPCKFKKIFDPYFFNCYTFVGPDVESAANHTSLPLIEGVENGLTVMLLAGTSMLDEVENPDEFGMPGIYARDSALSGAGGVRVVIHPPRTKPFPITEGYDVPPGQMASLGINPRRRVRLDKPYGNCSSTYPFLNEEEQKLDGPYRKTACEKVCVQDYIYRECNCYKNTLPTKMDFISDDHIKAGDRCFEENLSPEEEENCNKIEKCSGTREFHKCFKFYSKEDPKCDNKVLLKLFEKMKCAETVSKQMVVNAKLLPSCQCYPACDDFLYDVSYSLSKWPSMVLEAEAVHSEIMFTQQYLQRIKSGHKKTFYETYVNKNPLNKTLPTHSLKDFSKINVYVSDANVFLTTEEPAMTITQLVSEIGGQIGVWIGISVITIAELLEVLILMLSECCCRKKPKKDKPEVECCRKRPNKDKSEEVTLEEVEDESEDLEDPTADNSNYKIV